MIGSPMRRRKVWIQGKKPWTNDDVCVDCDHGNVTSADDVTYSASNPITVSSWRHTEVTPVMSFRLQRSVQWRHPLVSLMTSVGAGRGFLYNARQGRTDRRTGETLNVTTQRGPHNIRNHRPTITVIEKKFHTKEKQSDIIHLMGSNNNNYCSVNLC